MLNQNKVLTITGSRNNVRRFIEEQICTPFKGMITKDLGTKLVLDIPQNGFFTIKELGGIIISCNRLVFPSEVDIKFCNMIQGSNNDSNTIYNSIIEYPLQKYDIVTYTIPNIQYSKGFAIQQFLQVASKYKVLLAITNPNKN